MVDASELEIELLQLNISASKNSPHILREIVCRRPYRDGGLRLDAEPLQDGRCVIHCYGHGGSGWTLAPGCGQRILDLALQHFEVSQDAPRDVMVLGGGVIGLFAAYALAAHRDRHPGSIGTITVVAERFEDLTSHNAGGLFEPFSIGAEPDFQLLVDSYTFYHRIALGESPEPEFNTFDIEHLSLFTMERDPMPSLTGLGYIPHGVPGRMRIGRQLHETFVHRIFFMDVSLLMQNLLSVVARRGVRLLRGVRVRDLNELQTPVVVQCAGLATRDLIEDANLRPVLGHLIRLQNQSRALLDIEHDLHVSADQVATCHAAVSDFLSTPIEELLTIFPPEVASENDLVRVRFPDGFETPVRACLEPFYDILGRIRGRLEMDTPHEDPDFQGHGRIRVFDSGCDRNRFVEAISLISRVSELRGADALLERTNRLLTTLIPRFAKRYGFVAQRSSGLSYFLPILHEPVVREADGRFRYVSEAAAFGPVAAGVVGGTTIDREDLSLEDHWRELAGVAERLRALGFSQSDGS